MNKSTVNLFPTQIDHSIIGSTHVFTESLVPGNSLEMSDPSIVFRSLYPLYNNTVKVEDNKFIRNKIKYYTSIVPTEFRESMHSICSKYLSHINSNIIANEEFIISEIHGDLTFHNCSLESDSITFYDVDRFENSFPEFDLFTIYIDSQFKFLNRSSKNHIELVLSLKNDNKLSTYLSMFYESNNIFKKNSKNLSLIFNLYSLRTISYIFNDATYNPNIIKSLNQFQNDKK